MEPHLELWLTVSNPDILADSGIGDISERRVESPSSGRPPHLFPSMSMLNVRIKNYFFLLSKQFGPAYHQLSESLHQTRLLMEGLYSGK